MLGKPRNPIEQSICEKEDQILKIKEEIQSLRSELPPEKINNYELQNLNGDKITLKELFGDKDELLLIHNMGPQCPYCTLWADGFRTMKSYFESRCAFVLETDKAPAELAEFAKNRGWDFKVVSSENSSLKLDLGFKKEKWNLPGVSSLFLENGEIYRHATAPFGPGDNFAPIWHFFDLLKKGTNEWQPKFNL